jgi:hypothetical protein
MVKWLSAYQWRMAIAVLIQILIYFYPMDEGGDLPTYYFLLILAYYLLSSACSSIMNVLQVCDISILYFLLLSCYVKSDHGCNNKCIIIIMMMMMTIAFMMTVNSDYFDQEGG